MQDDNRGLFQGTYFFQKITNNNEKAYLGEYGEQCNAMKHYEIKKIWIFFQIFYYFFLDFVFGFFFHYYYMKNSGFFSDFDF